MPQESFATVDGCRIRMMREGRGAPLLFLHGGNGASEWRPFMADLAQAFGDRSRASRLRRLLTPGLRGRSFQFAIAILREGSVAIYRMLRGMSFDEQAVKAMTAAYETI